MSPAPASSGDTPRFDPRSEKFLESLRNLIEFKVRRENFDENSVEIHNLFSRSMIDALDFAMDELEGDGWYVMSITRVLNDEFLSLLCGGQSPTPLDDSDGFVSMMTDLFGHSGRGNPESRC